jgi:type IV pilus assembly protein PilQ
LAAEPVAPSRAAAPVPTSDVTAFAPAGRSVADFEAQDVQPMGDPEPGVPRLTPAVVAGQTVISSPKEYSGETISMSLKDADVREVLRTFARLSGLNVVIQPGVRGTVTVELERVPWDQALDQILKINGLGYELEGNIMRVAPIQVLEREAKRAQSLRQAQALSVPLRTVVKRLSYSQANQIAGLLQRGGGGVMSQRGSVIVDQRTNTLILKELPNFIDTVLAVIETLDTPEPQVVIEARIVETTKQFSKTLGIRWGFNGVADEAHGNTTGLEFPYHGTANGGVSLLTGGSNGFIDLALGNVLDTFTLNARLQVAESEGLVNVLSAPKVATLNNSAASIQSGTQIPIQTTANNTTSVQFVNATLKLDVTPHVTAEGTVLMDIKIQKREPLFALQVAGSPSAPIATKDAKTRVIVRDGGTTVIGGIYTVSTNQGQDRVPGLSNVPLLGNLFKNRRASTDNDELLIFITPRVIKL